MAANGSISDFENWLCKKLTELEIDADVYGSYITGILEEEDESENKKEALEGILGSLLEDPEGLCEEVLEKWKPFTEKNETKAETKSTIEDILAAHSAKVTNVQATEKLTNNNSSAGDSAMKRALLEKYAEVYEEVDEDEQEMKKQPSKPYAPTLGLFQNVNVKTVSDAEKQKREKQKEENQKKKEKDKLDRQKQMMKKEERKEKEKKRTQKQERKAR
ncbi:coiled-coil domain-containing protein 43-like [Styela clava]